MVDQSILDQIIRIEDVSEVNNDMTLWLEDKSEKYIKNEKEIKQIRKYVKETSNFASLSDGFITRFFRKDYYFIEAINKHTRDGYSFITIRRRVLPRSFIADSFQFYFYDKTIDFKQVESLDLKFNKYIRIYNREFYSEQFKLWVLRKELECGKIDNETFEKESVILQFNSL